MKTSLQRRVFGVVILLSLFAAACVPVPIGKSWAEFSQIKVYGQPALMVAFGDRLVLVNPLDGGEVNPLDEAGRPVVLKDSDGEARTNTEDNTPLFWQVIAGQTNGPVSQGNPVEFYSVPIALDEDTLLAVGYTAHVYTIDLPSARVEAPAAGVALAAGLSNERNAGHIIIPPILSDGILYVGFSEQNFLALDVNNDFAERWRFETERGIWGKPLLVADTNTLYIPGMDHHLFALNAQTGEERWRLDLGGAVAGTPVYHNGYLFIGSFDRKLFMIKTPEAVDGGDVGEIAAVYQTKGWVWGSPTLDDSGMLYVADLEGWVYALRVTYPGSGFGGDDSANAEAGFEEAWSRQAAQRGIRPSPLVTRDYVVVGARDQRVYWLNRETGETSFQQALSAEVLSDLMLIPTESSAESAPDAALINPNGTAVEGLVIVSSMNFQELLVAFNLETSARTWGYSR